MANKYFNTSYYQQVLKGIKQVMFHPGHRGYSHYCSTPDAIETG